MGQKTFVAGSVLPDKVNTPLDARTRISVDSTDINDVRTAILALGNPFEGQIVYNDVTKLYYCVTSVTSDSSGVQSITVINAYINVPLKRGVGQNSVAQVSSEALGALASAFGENTSAIGDNSHAEGQDSKATGKESHAEGDNTEAIGNNSHAEGHNCMAIGASSHAEGKSTMTGEFNGGVVVKEGDYAHAEGFNTIASGLASHAEGSSIARGDGSHAEGDSTEAVGENSHAEGYNTIANNNNEHAQGVYNKSNSQTIHSIGIGYREGWDIIRKNAVEVDTHGDIYLHGIGGYDGTNPDTADSLQTVIANILEAIYGSSSGDVVE